MIKIIRRILLPTLLVVTCAVLFLRVTPAYASTYTVNCTAADLVTKIGQAVTSNNQADTVTLEAGCTYTLTAAVSDGTDNGANGLRRLTGTSGALTINGNGATIERSSAGASFRLFEVASGSLTINNLTLAGGQTSDGGAIFNGGGAITIRNSTLTNNGAAGLGGAIANAGTLTLIDSTINGNSAGDQGGAIYSDVELHVVNSTISGNIATHDGGGIYNIGTLTLVQTTLAANSAGRYGGGLYTNNTTTLHNSIVAGSTNGGDCSGNGLFTISLTGAAVVEDGGCGLTGAGYLNADPLLGPLADNGGPSLTHALLPRSPAIDAGSAPPGDITTDQRGLPRVVGSAVDLGAFEQQQPFVTNVTSPSADDTYGVGSAMDITVTFSQAVEVTGAPQLLLETGDVGASANYAGGSGATTLTFSYTVAAGHVSADLDYASNAALVLNGGTIQTPGDQAALLALPEPGATGSLGANKALVIAAESVEPELTVTIEQAATQNDPTNSSSILFTAIFSAPVSGFSSAGIDLSASTFPGDLVASIAQAAPNDGTTYTITISGMTGDGDVVAAITAAAAQSASGKPNDASSSADNAVAYDTTAPDTTFDSAPPALTRSHDAMFTFSSEPGATFECSFNGADYEPCASSVSYDSLSDDVYTFAVRAVDAAGNADPTPASAAFTVDTTAPDTTLDSAPAAVTNDPTPAFTFSSADADAFECKLDSGDYALCESPFTPAEALPDGPHTFAARAIDAAGNSDETPVEHNFSVDTAAPTVEVTSSAANPTNLSLISVTIRFSEPVSGFEVAELGISNGSPGALSSTDARVFTLAITPTFDGKVSVNIPASVAQDAAGNGNSALESLFEVFYDGTAPNTYITSPLNNALVNEKRPEFSFHADENDVLFSCTLDLNSFPCTSTYIHGNDLAQGSHSFTVTATDEAGNSDTTPASINFTVDTFAPEIYLWTGPDDPSTTSSVRFTFTSPDTGATFECRLGTTAEYSGCSSPHDILSLEDDRYTFYVRAVDLAGNRSAPSTRSFTVDTTPPNVDISRPEDGEVTKDATPEFAFSSADSGATFECRLNTNSFESCRSPYTPSVPLTEGPHRFDVRARDAAGNVASTSVTLTIDSLPPDTMLNSWPDAVIPSNEARFTFSSSESGVRFECKLDTVDFTTCTSPHTVGPLSEDEHVFQVRAIDSAENTDPTPAEMTFTVDLSAPDTTLDSAPDDVTDDNTPTFAFSSPDSSAGFECKLDDGDYDECQSPYSAALQDGEHTFSVRAVDSAGHADPTPETALFTVEATDPAVASIRRVHASPTNRASVDFSVRFIEAVTGVDADAFTLAADGLTGAAISAVTGSGDTYVVTVATGSGNGSLRLDVRDDTAISDASDHPLAGGYSSGETYTVVRTGPFVENIVYTIDNSTLLFTVTFSAAVSGVDESDFALSANRIDATITDVSGGEASYTVTVTWSGVGTLALALVDDDSITDQAGNPLGGEGAGNGNTNGPTFDHRPGNSGDDHDDEDNASDSNDAEDNPPAPLLADIDGSTHEGIRARVPAGAYGIFGRVLAIDGQFVADPAQIGSAEVLSHPILAAVDVFSPNGGSARNTEVCLRGHGDILFLDATTSPRRLMHLYSAAENDTTCTVLPANGTVVLVAS